MLTLYLVSMVIKVKEILYASSFLILFVFLQNCTCKKGLGIDCSNNIYRFKINILITPTTDTVNIGDTIWMRMNNTVNLLDINTGNTINFSGAANLGSVLNIRTLSGQNEFTTEAINKFNYHVKEGALIRMTNDIAEYNFSEKNNQFLFNLGVIAKEKGTFRILFSNAANVYRNSDKCTKATFIINVGNVNRNPYLNPFYTGGPYPEGGDYYFVVR